ncbi:AI-2E family transporter [Eubacteriales bacterium OttesenSCG-928-N13]|nr:AI-2E family transporter [Eubacteriales bacterium OttesenSCG-928-N13]
MKRLIGKEDQPRIVANIVIGCAVVLFAILVYRIDGLLSIFRTISQIMFPFTMGFLIAFLINPFMTTLENWLHKILDKRTKAKKASRFLCRAIAAVLCYVLLFGVIVGFLAIVLPQLVSSISNLISFITRYLYTHRADIETFLREFNLGTSENLFDSLLKYWEDFTKQFLSYSGALVVQVVNWSASLGSMLSQFFIGVIISVYVLFGKEKFAAQAKKLGCAFMQRERVETLAYWLRKMHRAFSGYIAGQLLLSLILGAVCYLFMLLFGWDYALLISVIVGVTNIIPVFGPIAGGVISVIIMLVVNLPNVMPAVGFGIFIIVLQQIEGNIVGPRVLGDSVGISSFWIMFSIIVGSGLFGLPGVFLGIPVFAVLYSIIQTITAYRLKKRGLPSSTEDYYGTGPLPTSRTENKDN